MKNLANLLLTDYGLWEAVIILIVYLIGAYVLMRMLRDIKARGNNDEN